MHSTGSCLLNLSVTSRHIITVSTANDTKYRLSLLHIPRRLFGSHFSPNSSHLSPLPRATLPSVLPQFIHFLAYYIFLASFLLSCILFFPPSFASRRIHLHLTALSPLHHFRRLVLPVSPSQLLVFLRNQTLLCCFLHFFSDEVRL